jgi:hypothetical protein
MRDREETRDPVKRGAVIVNYEALNTWLRFGTPIPPINNSEHRSLVGAELQPRDQKARQATKKE